MGVNAGNRVRGTSTTTGTGTYTVGIAPTGFQAFSTIADGTVIGYMAVLGANWEVGLGTLGSSGTTIARTAILQSSNANAAVNWGAGTKEIAHVVPSEMLAALEYTGGLRHGNFSGTMKIAGASTLQGGVNVGAAVGGTADAITTVLTPVITAYGDRMGVLFVPSAPNTGAATLAVNGLTARSIVKMGATALVAGDLATGVPAYVIYDLTNTRWILLNPQAVWPLTLGGTGASTAANARTNLGLGTAAVEADTKYAHRANNLSDLANAATARTNLGLGTAAVEADTKYAHRANNLSDLANAATARTNLGLGTIATQAANNVAITGGSVAGITDLAVADGGTGASDAATARSNLGAAATSHSHGIGDLSGVAAASHTHALADITNDGTLAAINHTVSTSAPSGGSNGDLWFVREA